MSSTQTQYSLKPDQTHPDGGGHCVLQQINLPQRFMEASSRMSLEKVSQIYSSTDSGEEKRTSLEGVHAACSQA